jgi:ceramide glucosyltransferase
MTLAAAMGLWWCALIALLFGSAALALMQPWVAAGRASNEKRPPVSVLVPLREAGEAESVANASIIGLDYPELEVLFSVKEADQGKVQDDGVEHTSPSERCGEGGPTKSGRMGCGPLTRPHWEKMWAAGHTPSGLAGQVHLPYFVEKANRAARFIETAARPGFNPKIANLLEPLDAAAHDFLLIKDAGTALAPGTLAAMMRGFVAGTGLVCAVPIGRAPRSFAASVEAALINTYGARLVLAASVLGAGAGLGAAMLLDRRDLRAAGGLGAIATTIADDHALAKILGRQGLRTVLAVPTVDQDLGARRFADVWRRHLRWAVCRRVEEPMAFHAEPLVGLVAACLAAWFGADWLGISWALLLAAAIVLWPLAEMILAILKGWPVTAGMPFAIILREMLMPVLWLAALLTREIAWGSTRIPVRRRRS